MGVHPPNPVFVPAGRKPLFGGQLIRILPRSRPQAGLSNLETLEFVLEYLDALPFAPMVPTSTSLPSTAGTQDATTQHRGEYEGAVRAQLRHEDNPQVALERLDLS